MSSSSEKLESFVERKAMKRAKELGWWEVKLMVASKRGVPDRVLIRAGRVVWMEFKRFGEEPSRQQQLRMSEIFAHGAEVYWVDTYEQAIAILDTAIPHS